MKKFLLTTVALLGLSASAAFATPATDAIVAALQAQDYTRIELTVGVDSVMVEAIKGDQKLEATYVTTDGVNWTVASQHTSTIQPGDSVTPGVEINTDGSSSASSDGSDDDSNEMDDNNESDDDHGSGSDSDHSDSNDSSDDDSGSDD